MSTEPQRNVTRLDFLRMAAASTAALMVDWDKLSASVTAMGGKQDLPVVVIGGGLGGLSAAAHLARRGFPVTLVEQHFKPGGYATTFERADGKFSFDVSLHATGSADGALRGVLEGAGVLGNVETIELPELCRIVTPDHDMIWPQRDPAGVVEQLVDTFPDQAEGIRGFFGTMMGILDEAMEPYDSESWWDRLRFPLTHRKMWGIRNQTLADVLDEHVLDPQVRSLLSVFWPYYGLPPSQLSGFYYSIATASYLRFGGHYIKPRSQQLSDALREAIEASGGTVLLGTKATGITLTDGAVAGVTLEDGSNLEARAVISNASVPETMKMIVEETPPGEYPDDGQEYLARLQGYRPSLSTFLVWLGLNQEIREKVKGYEIFVTRNHDVEGTYQACLTGDPLNAVLGVTVYDNAFEEYSRPGSSTVQILMLSGYGPWRRFETDYFAGAKDAYYEEKERITGMLIDEAERWVIPGLRSMIEVVEAATPLTNVRFTMNPDGAIYGYEQSLANAYMNRLPNRTPFEGIYLASAWTDPGGGYQPCLQAGAAAFVQLMRDWGAEA